MMKKVRAILRACHDCRTSNYTNQHTYVEMKNIITKGKGEILCVDFLGPLPRATQLLKQYLSTTRLPVGSTFLVDNILQE